MDDDFIQFCKLNEIKDVELKAKEVFKKGFDLVKYGNQPFSDVIKESLPITKYENVPFKVVGKEIKEVKRKKDDLYGD